MIRKLLVFGLLGAVALCPSYSWADSTASAFLAARGALKSVAVRSAPLKAQAKAKNFPGGWHGQMVLSSADCTGFPGNLLFRHIIAMGGNNVRISTSHSGVLFGSSKDKGRKLTATRGYMQNGLAVGAALIYQNLRSNGNVADIGFGLAVSDGVRRCTAGYRAVGIRAF